MTLKSGSLGAHHHHHLPAVVGMGSSASLSAAATTDRLHFLFTSLCLQQQCICLGVCMFVGACMCVGRPYG